MGEGGIVTEARVRSPNMAKTLSSPYLSKCNLGIFPERDSMEKGVIDTLSLEAEGYGIGF